MTRRPRILMRIIERHIRHTFYQRVYGEFWREPVGKALPEVGEVGLGGSYASEFGPDGGVRVYAEAEGCCAG